MTVRKSELRRKIKNKDKDALKEDFKWLEKTIRPQLSYYDDLRAMLFLDQLQDYILEEAD